MKGRRKSLTEYFQKGLRTSVGVGYHDKALAECYNFIVDLGGLQPYSKITNPFEDVLNVGSFPLPQILFCNDYTFLVTQGALYELDSDYNIVTGVGFGVTRYDIIDYYSYILLASRTTSALNIRDPSTGVFTLTSVATEELPIFSTCTEYNGQIFAGNFSSHAYSLGANHVQWSQIGKVSFSMNVAEGGLKNESNFMKMPWNGEVYKIRTLGDKVIVYGDKGIGILIPMPDSPQVGFRTLSKKGIMGPEAVEGDSDLHIYVDVDGFVWRLSRDMIPRRIGYKEYMNRLTEVYVKYDKALKRFYITDGTTTFLITAFGMTQVFQSPTDVSNQIGYTRDQKDQSAYLETTKTNLDIAGVKTVDNVSVSTETRFESVTVGARGIGSDQLVESAVNPAGVGFPVIGDTALAFRVSFKDYTQAELQNLMVEYKITDHRFMRSYNFRGEL